MPMNRSETGQVPGRDVGDDGDRVGLGLDFEQRLARGDLFLHLAQPGILGLELLDAIAQRAILGG